MCATVFQIHANVENSWNEEEVWRVEMYVSFGVMSLGLLSLLTVTSIPSVHSALNWREFSFIQVKAGCVFSLHIHESLTVFYMNILPQVQSP